MTLLTQCRQSDLVVYRCNQGRLIPVRLDNVIRPRSRGPEGGGRLALGPRVGGSGQLGLQFLRMACADIGALTSAARISSGLNAAVAAFIGDDVVAQFHAEDRCD
jgi:hypothetical protein